MSKQITREFCKSVNGRSKSFQLAAAMAAVVVMTVLAPAGASASNPQSVDVVNTPNVNVVNTPAVTVTSIPPVTISGTPTVSITGSPGVTVNNTASQPLPIVTAEPSQVTHVGQFPSGHVVLQSFGPGNCQSWVRIDPSGNPSAFTIPNGEYLVVTDVDFAAFFTQDLPGYYNAMGLQLQGSVVLDAFALADPAGAVATQQHLTSGIVMAVLPNCFSSGANSVVAQVVMRGYLIPAR